MSEKTSKTNTATQLKQEIKRLIAKDYLKEVLEMLVTIFEMETQIEEDLDGITQLYAQYSKARKDKGAGIISWEEKGRSEANIRSTILEDYLDKITNESATTFYFQNSIFKRIVVFCREEWRIPKMKELFANRFYKRADEFLEDWEYEEIATEEKIDLIIYDNFTKDRSANLTEELKGILKHDEFKNAPILIYSPNRIDDLHIHDNYWKYLERVYYANSPFSIHSRIEEMLLYLKHKNAYKEAIESEES